MHDHTIVVGVGHVGTKIIEELQSMGEEIVAISLTGDMKDDFIQEFRDKGVTFIFGDGTQNHVLEAANIKHASRILAVTNDDLVNFKIAIRAKKLNPTIRTVLRIFDNEFAERIRILPEVDDTVSTSGTASTTFVAKAHIDGIYSTLKSKVKNKSVTFLLAKIFIKNFHGFNDDKSEINVLTIEKALGVTIMAINGILHPKEDDIIQINDELLVLGTIQEIKKFKMAVEISQ
jgi:Trk K+ transport system NAD-binding subunit